MAVSSLTAFWATSALLVLVPGADWAYAMTAGLRDRSVLPAVGGLLLGYVGLTAVVAVGVAAVLARTPVVLTVLTVLGAGYLIVLGVLNLARPGGTPGADAAVPLVWRRQVLKGAGVSGLNPKALLLFVALLPQFVDRTDGWPPAAQIAALGLIHMTTCGVVYGCVGVLARRVLRARPTAAGIVTRVSGLAMVVIGGYLLVDHLVS